MDKIQLIDKYLTEYGYILLYVFIATMCINMIFYIKDPSSYCYTYIEDYTQQTYIPLETIEQNTDCRLIGNQNIPTNKSHPNTAYIALIGWFLTSPKMKRLYKEKKIAYLQRL